jgi:diamine N-acetyltransferase
MNKLMENNIFAYVLPNRRIWNCFTPGKRHCHLAKRSLYRTFFRYSIKQYLIDYKHDIYVDKQLRLMVTLRETDECIGTVDLYDFDPFHRRAVWGY